MGIVKDIYSKCQHEFLLGLLVHRATPLLYSTQAKSSAELFLGHKLSTNIPCIQFGMAALMQHKEPEHKCLFEPKDGDICYARLDPSVNQWSKGFIVRQVVGVPDSYVVEVDGHRYRQNKRDITLYPLGDNEESDGHSDVEEPMAAGVIPTLHPRFQLKFPKLPVQATQQKESHM